MRSAPDRERLLFLFTAALPLFAIWGVAFPPLLDFPEHALIAQVVARGSYDAGSDYHGALGLHTLWAPYGMFYLLALPIARLGSAIFATKLWLSAAVLATAFALRWMLATLGRDRYAFYFGFPFLFSTAYLVGLVPYVLGLPFLIVSIASVLRQPVTTRENFLPRLALVLATVWAHPLIYAATAPALAAIVLVLHWRAWRQVAVAALWIGIPAIYLLAWTPAFSAHHRVTWEYKGYLLRSFASNLGAYDTPSPERLFLLPKLPLLIWLAWALAMLKRREPWSRTDKALAAGIGALLLLVAALPEFYSSQMVTPSFRFTPIALVLASALLASSATRPPRPRALLVTWCLAALAAHCVLAVLFDRQMDGFVTLARLMEPRQTVIQRHEGPENVLYSHALSYYLIAKGGLCPQPLLANPNVRHFPARLLPPFPWDDVDWESNDPLTHPAGRVFRYVLVKTSGKETDPLPEPPPPFHQVVARSGGWLLLERR